MMNRGTSESPPSDTKNRPFVCPCGKSYLSYPALFTHIKQKHQGKAPGKVVRPKSQNKRGRPRKLPNAQASGDGSVERPEFKSFACRLLFDNQEEKELGYLIDQVENAKQRYRASVDFVPPITTSHLALILPPSDQPAPEQANTDPSSKQDWLRTQLRQLFDPLRSGSNLASPSQLEQLISLNVPYLLSLQVERKSSRRPIGCDLWEMELRTALLEFLDSLKYCLSRGQFRNVEILMGLLLFFFTREVSQQGEVTTANYVQHLNSFAGTFLPAIAQLKPYSRVYSLQRDRPMKILVLLHQWMIGEGLTDYVVEIASQDCVKKEREEQSQGRDEQDQN